MSRPMSIQILTALVLALGMTRSSMVAAESPYLILKFTESYQDDAVIGRRFAGFRDVNGTNTCHINHWPYRKDETNAARIDAILTGALEKEGTRDARGVLRRKPKSEIVFSVPVDSIQLLYGWPTNFALVTDFSGWKLVSPSRTEVEKSETLEHVAASKRHVR